MNVDELHKATMDRFDSVDERLGIQNGKVRTLELWQARMDGARTLGIGLWQMLATGAAVVAAGVAVELAVTGGR